MSGIILLRVWKGDDRLVKWQTQDVQKAGQVAFDPKLDPSENKPRQWAVPDTTNLLAMTHDYRSSLNWDMFQLLKRHSLPWTACLGRLGGSMYSHFKNTNKITAKQGGHHSILYSYRDVDTPYAIRQ